MAMSWFRKKPKDKLNSPIEHTPGGYRIVKHPDGEFAQPQFGAPSEEMAAFAESRRIVYEQLFGVCDIVHHEVSPIIPHMDVYRFPPGHMGREFWTYVTSGMSDLAMTRPPGVSNLEARREIIFYCDKPRDEYPELLRRLGHFPHDNKTWLSESHTFPWGDPPGPLFVFTPHLDTIIFTPTLLWPDNELHNKLTLAGDPVSFLWVLPITSAECAFILANGANAFYARLGAVKHPHVFTGDRQSYL